MDVISSCVQEVCRAPFECCGARCEGYYYAMNHRKILLGVSGGIAAYKAAELTRLLVRRGASVRVVMTRGAQAFVTPMTFQALSGEAVRSELFDDAHEAAMGHIELARWADAVLIAPASANVLARLAGGMADDLLTTLCLATPAPVAVAPAMNQQMWRNPATQANVALLRERGTHVFGPATGEQACGDIGPGRMLEPPALLEALSSLLASPALAGKRVLVTAGPTREPLDPVRFLSNRSSGKMGFAVAEAAARAGADVVLIAGPVALPDPGLVKRVNVETAAEMHTAALEHLDNVDVFIATAAVSDYRPAATERRKIKKDQATLQLSLTRNPDILAEIASRDDAPFCVGFAAETDRLEEYALAKLRDKRLDMVAANPVGDGQGFDSDDNRLIVFWPEGQREFPLQSKTSLARELIDLIAERLERKDEEN